MKEFSSDALIILKRQFLENLESEILRGISTLAILSIINENGESYGYQILRQLEKKTGSMLIIEDGTLYPILKKLQREELIEAEKKVISGRKRTYYRLTNEGRKIFYHMQGFFTKLVESISSLMDMHVSLSKDVVFCPNCVNRIDLSDLDTNYCSICGLNIEDMRRRL